MTEIIHETAAWHNRTNGTTAVEALQKNGFDAVYFDGREEAVDYMLGFVSSGMSIGFGGSMTLGRAWYGRSGQAEGRAACA